MTTPLSLKPACSSAHDRKHAHVLDLMRVRSGMYVQLSIIKNESSSILQANYSSSICSLTSHTSIAKD